MYDDREKAPKETNLSLWRIDCFVPRNDGVDASFTTFRPREPATRSFIFNIWRIDWFTS